MLILKRRLNESVQITVPPSDREQTITVTIADWARTNNRVVGAKLGFTADKSIIFMRSELLQKGQDDAGPQGS